jgi:hypothetical protein
VQVPNANETLYAAGNPQEPYTAIPQACAYVELDREHSRLTARLGVLRGELATARADLKTAKLQALVCVCALGAVAVGALLTVGILFLR